MINARNLTKRYGDVTALDDVSFDVESGEIFGLIGPDGAGKTTLFRILATLLVPDQGEVTVDGLNVVADYRELRSRLGYMPGRFSLYPDLSVEENLTFFASVFGTTVEDNMELIAPIYGQIEPFRKRRAGALSGGMKQKLALSCALVHRPRLLLLDEPTTGVDAVSRREFWEMLGDLRDGGLTIVVSTPYMDEASRCDRIALISRGHILGIHTPGEIAHRFEHPLLEIRSGCRYAVLQALRRYEHTHSAYAFGDTIHFADRRPEARIDDLRNHLANEGHEVAIAPIRPGIEDLFMELSASEEAAA
jgi:ABC-2 type transport system ATP-binding protein